MKAESLQVDRVNRISHMVSCDGLRHPHVPHASHRPGRRAEPEEHMKRDGMIPVRGRQRIGHSIEGDVGTDRSLEPAELQQVT
jgi:hypothetical protein